MARVPLKRPALILLLFLPLIGRANAGTASGLKKLPSKVWVETRRILNFSNLFGSPLSASPYERCTGHPVFSVTTPWGSPYMNMEKLSDLDEVVKPEASVGKKPQSYSEEQNEFRTVVLYFMDPDDALAVHGEMKQMDNMGSADVRITASSLSKAMRQAANFGNGLVTGMEVEKLSGSLKPPEEGGSLRYKIVPPKRQLYYAARCIGKERVGLFGENPAEDAQMAVMGNSALEGMNLMRRREKRERKTPTSKPKSPLQAANQHMVGYTGIPVFYAPNMHRRLPILKRLFTGHRDEIPLFFNYEDLTASWDRIRAANKKAPNEPPAVEVFNLWDVVTSMDRSISARQKQKAWLDKIADPVKNRVQALFPSKQESSSSSLSLNDITFIPSSRASHYKEAISARGNGKARLRPMR